VHYRMEPGGGKNVGGWGERGERGVFWRKKVSMAGGLNGSIWKADCAWGLRGEGYEI